MTRKIKILFTIPNFDTAGSGKVLYDLVKGLDKTKFAPEICCFHNQGEFFKAIVTLGVPIHIFNFSTPYRPYLSFPIRVLKIAKFFKAHDFDIIHSWHWRSDVSEPLAAKLAGIPFVFTKKAMGWGNKSWKWRSKLSTKIITINSDMVRLFFFKMQHKVVQIPLGVDTKYFNPNHSFELKRQGLGLEPTDFVVITVANLVPVKGIELLIEAIKQLKAAHVKLIIVGDDKNDYGDSLKSTYKSKNIQFLGKQEDVRPYLSLSDIFIIPTKNEGRKEGLPIAPLEAMATQKIVIGSDVAGIKDILKSFPECQFQAGNAVALAHRIKTVMEMSQDTKDTLALNMRQVVERLFAITKCVAKHETLYKNMIQN